MPACRPVSDELCIQNGNGEITYADTLEMVVLLASTVSSTCMHVMRWRAGGMCLIADNITSSVEGLLECVTNSDVMRIDGLL